MMQSVAEMTYDRITANLWSAGHEVEPDARSGMRSAGWSAARRYSEGDGTGLDEIVEQTVRDHLVEMGFKPTADRSPRMLGVKAHANDRPGPGDAVRLTGEWSCVPSGDFLVLSGNHGADGYTVARGRHAMSARGVMQTSGGPCSIMDLSCEFLTKTDDRREMQFWRFRDDRMQAHSSIEFVRNVRVWEWSGNPRDFAMAADAA